MTQTPEGIVVLGCPRSGTTLLRRLLDAHSNIACPSESYLFNACGRFLRGEKFAEGLEIGVLNGISFMGFEADDLLDRLRDLAFEFHRAHASKQGKGRWAEKTAFDAFYLPEIERLLGDRVSYICVQRHGLDVAVSLQDLAAKTGGYVEELHRYVVQYPQPLEAFAHVWADLASGLHEFAQRHADRAVTVKYEDLTADPESELKRLLAFVDEPWEDDLLDKALSNHESVGFNDWKSFGKSSIDRGSIGRWKQLPQATIGMLAEIANPVLTSLGYEAVDVEAQQRSDEEARRRYELGLLLQRAKEQADD